MKTKRYILCAFSLMASFGMFAQSQYDAERFIGTELSGTARFVGMGGAMGALGGDMTVMGTNPAGIGIYRSNDIALSFGANNTAAEATFYGTTLKDNRTRWSLDQVGFVYSNKIGNNTSLRYVNFGFNYRKTKNFNKLFKSGGDPQDFSQTMQMVDMLDQGFDMCYIPENEWADEVDKLYVADNPYLKGKEYPYLGIMGVKTDLIGISGADNLPIGWKSDMHNYSSREEGGINEYNFNVAFNIEDRMFLGATIGAYDVNYKRFSYYTEDIYDGAGNEGYYDFANWFQTKGTGLDLKLGFIGLPFEDSPFRIGFAIHTPTWYNLTDYHTAELTSYNKYIDENGILGPEITSCQDLYVKNNDGDIIIDYQLVTPWKFNLSAGTTFSNVLAVGAEYEYSDYSSAKLKYDDGVNMDFQNDGFVNKNEANNDFCISDGMKAVHTLRLGMEAKLAPRISFRAGYNYSTAAFKNSAYKLWGWNSMRTDTEYNNTKDRNTLTLGWGYKSNFWYADLAFKHDCYKSDFYAFNDGIGDMAPSKIKNTRNQVIFTLGARF